MPSSTASSDAGVVAWPFRRFPTLVEATARVDFPALSGTFDAATDAIVAAYAGIRRVHVASLVEQAGRLMPDDASTSTGWLDDLALAVVDAAPITAAITEAVAAGQAGALAEAAAQGVRSMPRPEPAGDVAARAGAGDRAAALERVLAGGLLQTVKREGVRIAAARMDAAAAMQRILGDKPTRAERGILKAGSTGGVNEGRLSVIRTIRIGTASIEAADGDPPPASEQVGYLYATELLDDNTCDPCAAVDGTQYESLDDAENDYPGLGGGYVWCDGREACRGSLVVVYADVAPPTVDGGSSQAQAIADRVAREQIKQDAIDRRAAADAREAFRSVPPPEPPDPGAPGPTPPEGPPPVPFSSSVGVTPRVAVTGEVVISPAERADHARVMTLGRAIAQVADSRIAARSSTALAKLGERPGPPGEQWFFDQATITDRIAKGLDPLSEEDWALRREQQEWDAAAARAAPTNDEQYAIERRAITEATGGRVTFGVEDLDLVAGSTRADEAKLIAQRLPDRWVSASNFSSYRLRIEQTTKANPLGVNRSSYQRTTGGAGYRGDTIKIAAKSNQDVMLHELVHRIESVVPELRRAEYVFGESRARGGAWDGVREAPKLIGKTKAADGRVIEEWAIPDQWREIYSGKEYALNGTPDQIADTHREIATVGMQTLAGGNAEASMLSPSVIRADEEYRAWMLGILALLG